jgi:hypothetical protein
VLLSVALVVVQERYSWYGGVQVTMRQATGPLQAISWWHWPYRKTLAHTRRRSQVPLSAACGAQFQQLPEQYEPWPPQPELQRVHSAWQSM